MIETGADRAAVGLLALATAGWYVTSRAAAEALDPAHRSAGARAIGYAVPVALVAAGAVVAGRPEIATGVIFASSVACLTLVLGLVLVLARHTHPTLDRRAWGFVLPVALISLLIGFSGGLRLMHAALLLAEGIVLLLLWNDYPFAKLTSDTTRDPAPAQPSTAATRSTAGRIGVLVAALLASGVAAWLGIAAARDIANFLELPGAGLIAALMLAPALVLSMIGSGSRIAAEGRFDDAVAEQVGFVLLNLCLTLPLITVLWITRPEWSPWLERFSPNPEQLAQAATQPAIDEPAATHQADDPFRALPYPLGVWRVDTVLLIAVGLLLLPVSLGRLSLDRGEGLALVVAYALYMILTTLLSR